MIKVLAAKLIITAKKCSPNAARSAMVIRCMVQADLLASGDCHVESIRGVSKTITTKDHQEFTAENCLIPAVLRKIVGVLVLRIALPGRGKRGSVRTLIVYQNGTRGFFFFVFAKNERSNIDTNELAALKLLAKALLEKSNAKIEKDLKTKNLIEVIDNG